MKALADYLNDPSSPAGERLSPERRCARDRRIAPPEGLRQSSLAFAAPDGARPFRRAAVQPAEFNQNLTQR